MHQQLPSRSDEPIYWLMFGSGGMVAAMALPALLIVMIVAGITSPDVESGMLSFAQMKLVLGNWFLSLILFGIVFMLLFYSLHRIYHSTHDIGLHTKAMWFACYGAAAAVSFIVFGVQLLIYCKLF